ncbi:uncharacterized protein LOC103507969 isoform X1 [Diaphorina citri]|uniref:Uncharacterized protein LOC103507969 isoform X1 n=1 Tax=Diaphorina citri TaxID=121845 RepID=A0A1S3CYZ2_DIACI|nr:uncharacterized protein LOC103507969 isoform X1 [Diaphorina citri]
MADLDEDNLPIFIGIGIGGCVVCVCVTICCCVLCYFLIMYLYGVISEFLRKHPIDLDLFPEHTTINVFTDPTYHYLHSEDGRPWPYKIEYYSKHKNTSDQSDTHTWNISGTGQQPVDCVNTSVQNVKSERGNASLIMEYRFDGELSTWNDFTRRTTVGFNTTSRFLTILNGTSTMRNTTLIT